MESDRNKTVAQEVILMLTEITLHYVSKTHRAGGVDLVKRYMKLEQQKARTCDLPARQQRV